VTRTQEKRKGKKKGRTIKETNRKRWAKAIKKLKHTEGDKGRIKRRKKNLHKKTIKEEESKIKVLAHELLASTLS
jgi:hypothetical protein